MGKLTVWMTTQAPHAIRTVFALVTGLPEQKIRILSPDIGGGFGGKGSVVPAYSLLVVAALKTRRSAKLIEVRSAEHPGGSFAAGERIDTRVGLAADCTVP